MKRRLILSTIFTGTLLLASCSDDFLETEPTEFITSDQLEYASSNNPNVIRGTVSGIYTMMFEPKTGGTTGHNDFGQKGYDIMTDMLSGDMALSNNVYNWYRNLCDYQSTTDFTRTDNYIPWRYYYRVIRSTNVVIAALGGNEAVPEVEENKWLMGQAKALRGYAYFYLTQLYAREYNVAQDILPIYTDPEQTAGPKSPTSDVYNLIESDLTSAIELLADYTRPTKTEIDVNVAKSLLAYTYAAMGRDSEAKVLTDEVIISGGYPLTTQAQTAYPGAGSGFNNVNTASWMWGVDLTTDQGIDLVSWWGQIDIFTYSYASAGDRKSIDLGLYNLIPNNDVRKQQFVSGYFYMPANKFFDPGRAIEGQRVVTTDNLYMRIDEIYLLNAETAAKSGDEAMAKDRLKALLALRIPDNTYVDGLTGQALLDEIYKQTRIELWGEGKVYLAMKRNRKTITRGPNHIYHAGESVDYNDPKLTFKIPQAEILNNPFISEQN